ncbi:hypothetical protein F5X96DRAFT_450056 [Biscogniauxia mediterranea]|nr:hypothetical protein F5X96DRAFT_450056 [Biscogniauxia mediterranea]
MFFVSSFILFFSFFLFFSFSSELEFFKRLGIYIGGHDVVCPPFFFYSFPFFLSGWKTTDIGLPAISVALTFVLSNRFGEGDGGRVSEPEPYRYAHHIGKNIISIFLPIHISEMKSLTHPCISSPRSSFKF